MNRTYLPLLKTLFFVVIFFTTKTTAQSHFDIAFSGVDGVLPQTIHATNLSKQLSVTLQGSDILRLNYLVFGLGETELVTQELVVFPNPMEHQGNFSFVNPTQGIVTIHLFTISGKQLFTSSMLLSQGKYSFTISGVAAGTHLLEVITSFGKYAGKFSSTCPDDFPVLIQQTGRLDFQEHSETFQNQSQPSLINDQLRSPAAGIVNLYFTHGDTVRIDASSPGCTCQTIYLSPTTNQTISFLLTQLVDVLNPTTGKTWMDRNLGAKKAAVTEYDPDANGDLYQWGRGTDGHEKHQSPVTSVLSPIRNPAHGSFITSTKNANYNWLSTPNDNLWQDVDCENNPCPEGYRVPTEAEWVAEISTWSKNNSVGAFESPLKFVKANGRNYFDAKLTSFVGNYWTSTTDGEFARGVAFDPWMALTVGRSRASGCSVRCIKN